MSVAGPTPPPGGVAPRLRQILGSLGHWAAHEATIAGHAVWLALRRLGHGDDLTFASSIAYYALLSLFPLLLLLFGFLGRFTTDPADHTALTELVLQYFPQRLDFIATQRRGSTPHETESSMGGRAPIWQLDRAGTAGLGFEGDVLLGWRGGDAVAMELA